MKETKMAFSGRVEGREGRVKKKRSQERQIKTVTSSREKRTRRLLP